MRVRFGDCIFDSESRQLLRGGKPSHLSPKALRLLEALLESRPRAVPKAELHDRIWPETFVSATGLGRLLTEVRAAVGDDARTPRVVRTVHGFGYAFCATVIADAPPPDAPRGAFRLIWGTREIALSEGANVLGRSDDCAVWIDSETVSRHHAQILISQGTAMLEDLGSKNGTYRGGTKIEGPCRLSVTEIGEDLKALGTGEPAEGPLDGAMDGGPVRATPHIDLEDHVFPARQGQVIRPYQGGVRSQHHEDGGHGP